MKNKKIKISPPPTDFNFTKLEQKILSWWYSSGLVEQYLHQNDSSTKTFSFLDGPITANNPMGVHHAWGRTLKDLYQRYKNMQGFKQRFQNGFDCQGLWIEVEVEKEKGFKNKKDIEDYGVARFIEDCKNRAQHFASIQIEQSKRLGYFMDWGNDYYTLSDENNYAIWHFLKKCWQDGNLYKGRDSVPWCPRCGTAISQHEILNEEYQEITHDSIFFELPIVDRENERFLVWTTTPWTLPANVALAVHPDLEYWQVEGDTGIKFWLAGSLASKLFSKNIKPLKKLKGKKLEGLRYQGPFDSLPAVQKAKKENPKTFHTVILSQENVNDQEGTGIVHLAPGCGQEDFQMGKEKNLPILPAVDESANYLPGFADLTGKNAKENPNIILKHPLLFKKTGHPAEDYVFSVSPYTHRYPVCWRCKTELIWRVVHEWYISMDQLRHQMMAVTKKIKWIPAFGEKLELDWLKNMHDWMISKKRYWGLALPIWECKCGEFTVIGSKEELKEKAIEGWDKFSDKTPHRPWIDQVKISCPHCQRPVQRISAVGNPWLDAGIVAYSTLKYFEDKKYWQQWFPADLVLECFPGQFKNWFYALIAMSSVLENKAPLQTLLGHALVKDEHGEEMHKSKGNAIWFDEAAEKMGVDTMRWLYCRQNPENNLNFGYTPGEEVKRQFILLWFNTYRFFASYAASGHWQPNSSQTKNSTTTLDTWILSRLASTTKKATSQLDQLQHHEAIRNLEELISDLSLWYVRRSRTRLAPSNPDEKDRDLCFNTLYLVLKNLSILLAPFIPYLSEYIWQSLNGNSDTFSVKNSVHLQSWPKFLKNQRKPLLEKEMALARETVSLALAARSQNSLKVRQPLAKLTVSSTSPSPQKNILDLIKDEVNVKKLVWQKGQEKLVVNLDTRLTQDLKDEGEAREIIREIQMARKEKGLDLADQIILTLPSWPQAFEEEIKRKTLAQKIKKGEELSLEKSISKT